MNAGKFILSSLFDKLKESLVSVLPVSLLVIALSLTPLVNIPLKELNVFVIGAFLLIFGIGLFNLGADMAMTPMGQYIGEGLTKSRKIAILASVGFVMGTLITIAEPDLAVLASQVSSIMNGKVLIATVGIGVGLMLLLGVFKIVLHLDLTSILLYSYMFLFCLAAILIDKGKGSLLALSFDSGGVTTGPITVPFIMAIGVGIAMTIGGRGANENSFGLIALCSVGPILAVLALSLVSKGSLSFDIPDYSMDTILSEGIWELFKDTMQDVATSLFLVVFVFIILQVVMLRLPLSKLVQILIGLIHTFVGLVLFLSAVELSFMPIGFSIGTQLAAQNPWIMIGFAFVLGNVVVLAEPAVQKQMMMALSVGVGVSIGLSLLRVYLGFSLLYYLVPGYLLSLGLSFVVPKLYTAIAFDSGGVASGPLTSSFILPMVVGACVTMQGANAVLDFAFGVVAMVAMTPLITIQSLGFKSVMSVKYRKSRAMRRIMEADEDQIIYFE